MKAHNKKVMRYKNYVIKFLKSTKQKRATRGTLRRNLVKLESRFLSIVLKELIENKSIEKKGQTYALVQMMIRLRDTIIFLSFPMFSRYLSLDMQLLCTSYILSSLKFRHANLM